MKTHLNLLPARFRQQMVIRRTLRQWILIGGAACLFLTIDSLFIYSRLLDEQNQYQQFETKAEPLRQLLNDNLQLEKQLQTLKVQTESIAGISNSNTHLQTLGLISQNARQLNDKLQILAYTLDEITHPAVSMKTITKPHTHSDVLQEKPYSMRLSLKGLSVDEDAVAGFMTLLESEPRLQNVNLKSITRNEYYRQTLQTFEIECLL